MKITAAEIILYRQPSPSDGAAVWELVRNAGSLEANSAYSYLMMFDMFRETCCIAKQGERTVGFVTAFRKPTHPDELFVWQIGVSADVRGRGIGRAMLNHIVRRENSIQFVEATISPGNIPSRSLFAGWARELGCPCTTQSKYGPEIFPAEENHEEEWLFTLGPIRF